MTSPDQFGSDYFRDQYPDYWRQNPQRKLAWYEGAIRRWCDADPIRFLDIGCGLGAFVSHMADSADVVAHGTDVSNFAIESNRVRDPRPDWRESSADEQPWSGGSFDAITALDVLEHLQDPEATLRSVRHMLQSDGVFVAVVPVYDGLTGPIVRALDRDPTHLHQWPRQRWLDLVNSHFEILEWAGAFRYLMPTRTYIHLPTRTLRRHAPAILIAARKR